MTSAEGSESGHIFELAFSDAIFELLRIQVNAEHQLVVEIVFDNAVFVDNSSDIPLTEGTSVVVFASVKGVHCGGGRHWVCSVGVSLIVENLILGSS